MVVLRGGVSIPHSQGVPWSIVGAGLFDVGVDVERPRLGIMSLTWAFFWWSCRESNPVRGAGLWAEPALNCEMT